MQLQYGKCRIFSAGADLCLSSTWSLFLPCLNAKHTQEWPHFGTRQTERKSVWKLNRIQVFTLPFALPSQPKASTRTWRNEVWGWNWKKYLDALEVVKSAHYCILESLFFLNTNFSLWRCKKKNKLKLFLLYMTSQERAKIQRSLLHGCS